MTARELVKELEAMAARHGERVWDQPLTVDTRGSLSAFAGNPVRQVSQGHDWTNGQTVITTESPVFYAKEAK